jgi:hypothetical protein
MGPEASPSEVMRAEAAQVQAKFLNFSAGSLEG